MDKVQTIMVLLALCLVGFVGIWLHSEHTNRVSLVERCEAAGGIAVIQAREGYACVKPSALQEKPHG